MNSTIDLCQKITDLLLARFDPDNPLPEPDFTLRLADVREEVERVDFQDTRIAIQAMLDATRFPSAAAAYITTAVLCRTGFFALMRPAEVLKML